MVMTVLSSGLAYTMPPNRTIATNIALNFILFYSLILLGMYGANISCPPHTYYYNFVLSFTISITADGYSLEPRL